MGKQDKKEILKNRVEGNLLQFLRNTNWECLVPELLKRRMLDDTARDYLLYEARPNFRKGLYFYVQVLPSKGHEAYSIFSECLASENDHLGHKSLVQILDC